MSAEKHTIINQMSEIKVNSESNLIEHNVTKLFQFLRARFPKALQNPKSDDFVRTDALTKIILILRTDIPLIPTDFQSIDNFIKMISDSPEWNSIKVLVEDCKRLLEPKKIVPSNLLEKSAQALIDHLNECIARLTYDYEDAVKMIPKHSHYTEGAVREFELTVFKDWPEHIKKCRKIKGFVETTLSNKSITALDDTCDWIGPELLKITQNIYYQSTRYMGFNRMMEKLLKLFNEWTNTAVIELLRSSKMKPSQPLILSASARGSSNSLAEVTSSNELADEKDSNKIGSDTDTKRSIKDPS